ncbi:unnamed protein product [Notodromas monacha]|uniref:Myelin regulatory factor n=1 Tax=Notodromas monacha TaxID=399045 RepID=A0A7R9GF70_9CRUS|nr:unnamed protein product [Notodromas monacha]CAG0920487.1 unnamed protein product [Notodromas monacha]
MHHHHQQQQQHHHSQFNPLHQGYHSPVPGLIPNPTGYPGTQQQQGYGDALTGLEPVTRKKRKLDAENVDIMTLSNCYKIEPGEGMNCSVGQRSQINSPANTGGHDNAMFDDESLSGGGDFDYHFGQRGQGDQFSADSQNQCIRFVRFQEDSWGHLVDAMGNPITLTFQVDADKGFNFSHSDDSFVCQKKNHFQVTCHFQSSGTGAFVKVKDRNPEKIESLNLNFFGVKAESPSQTIKIEQSQSDRSKKGFVPVKLELGPSQITKVTIGRLHFSETTTNNMRKKGKPNPDQRYFLLVVAVQAQLPGERLIPVFQYASDKIIVRASNPGQFENDSEIMWMKSPSSPENIFHHGKVGINTDAPDQAMTIYGNLKLTGQILQPSDCRVKEHVRECDTRDQLRTISKLRVVDFEMNHEVAKTLGRTPGRDRGLIAQEVAQVIPDAVHPTGSFVLPSGIVIDDFLTVDKERIFMENVGAVKELNKVVDRMQNRISELEKVHKKLEKVRRNSSIRGSGSSFSIDKAPSLKQESLAPCQKSCKTGIDFHPFYMVEGRSKAARSARSASLPVDRFDQCDTCCQHHHIYCLRENKRKSSNRDCIQIKKPVPDFGEGKACDEAAGTCGSSNWSPWSLALGICSGLALALVLFSIALFLMNRFGVIVLSGVSEPSNAVGTTTHRYVNSEEQEGSWIWSPFSPGEKPSTLRDEGSWPSITKERGDEIPTTPQRHTTSDGAVVHHGELTAISPQDLPPIIGFSPICLRNGSVAESAECVVVCRPLECPPHQRQVSHRESYSNNGISWSMTPRNVADSSSPIVIVSPVLRDSTAAGGLSNHIPQTSLPSSNGLSSEILDESPLKVSRMITKLRRKRNVILEEDNAVPVSNPVEKGSVIPRYRISNASINKSKDNGNLRTPGELSEPAAIGKESDFLFVNKRIVVGSGERGNAVDDEVLARPTPIDKIVLVDANRTLTSQYCLGDDHGCVFSTSGNWTYGIPVSMFSRVETMHLQFVYSPLAGGDTKRLPVLCDSPMPVSPTLRLLLNALQRPLPCLNYASRRGLG